MKYNMLSKAIIIHFIKWKCVEISMTAVSKVFGTWWISYIWVANKLHVNAHKGVQFADQVRRSTSELIWHYKSLGPKSHLCLRVPKFKSRYEKCYLKISELIKRLEMEESNRSFLISGNEIQQGKTKIRSTYFN